MIKQSNHCPHLGLKQNAAIRFDLPTPEHRCFVHGEAQPIPVAQTQFCLAQEHLNCPLYLGLELPETAANPNSPSRIQSWQALLAPVDRLIYSLALAALLVIISLYLVLGKQLVTGSTMVAPKPPTYTLYFADQTGRVFVTVTRSVTETRRLNNLDDPVVFTATLAVQGLLSAPPPHLKRSLAPKTRLLEIKHWHNLLTLNFTQIPGDKQALQALALTLTDLPGIEQVQIQVKGQNVGINSSPLPLERPLLNLDNPQDLPPRYIPKVTLFVKLYYLLGDYQVCLTRVIPHTQGVARATVSETLAGPGSYAALLSNPIPGGTKLLNVGVQGSIVTVNLSRAFLTAQNRRAAVDALVLGLTGLPIGKGDETTTQVEIGVEGQSLNTFWGPSYNGPFERPRLNFQ